MVYSWNGLRTSDTVRMRVLIVSEDFNVSIGSEDIVTEEEIVDEYCLGKIND